MIFITQKCRQLITCALLAATACSAQTASASGTMPSTFRTLQESYQALSVGTSITLAIELMGNPKARSDTTVLGVSYTEMTWVDVVQVRYQAKFIANHLVQKSASAPE